MPHSRPGAHNRGERRSDWLDRNVLTVSAFVDSCAMSPIVDIGRVSAYADIVIVRTARDLGAAVRDARLQQGWTQAELADRIDASRQWVISLERGKPSAELGTALRAIAALGMVANVVEAPSRDSGIDLDSLLGEGS
jgi:HTH-type transcriptional regulator / antitoxin HipB